ncbi:hypothetical protein EDB83DRAFT_2319319 [Lactarius deliciosus]|nr:hypothetical protein EDB83DRAFT_2319319 [Lactarius deliciosus]
MCEPRGRGQRRGDIPVPCHTKFLHLPSLARKRKWWLRWRGLVPRACVLFARERGRRRGDTCCAPIVRKRVGCPLLCSPRSRVNRGRGGRGRCLGLLFDMNGDEGENGGVPVLCPHCARKRGQGGKGGKGGVCHLHGPPSQVNWGGGAMGGLSCVVPRLHVVYRVRKGGPKDGEGLRAERGG